MIRLRRIELRDSFDLGLRISDFGLERTDGPNLGYELRWSLDTRYWMLDAGYSMLDARYSMLDAGCGLLDVCNKR